MQPMNISLMEDAILVSTEMAATIETSPKPVLTIAIECDQKCKTKLGGSSFAVEYIQALIAGVSTITERDIDRAIQISHIRIWDGPSPFDGGTTSLTTTFKEYYEQNMKGTSLSVSHFEVHTISVSNYTAALPQYSFSLWCFTVLPSYAHSQCCLTVLLHYAALLCCLTTHPFIH